MSTILTITASATYVSTTLPMVRRRFPIQGRCATRREKQFQIISASMPNGSMRYADATLPWSCKVVSSLTTE